jgi:membrane protease YdiL (CAAX protease family)
MQMTDKPSSTTAPGKPPFLRQAAVLGAGGVIGTVAVTPYLMELLHEQFEKSAAKTGLGMPAVAAIFVLQTAVSLGVAVSVGLWAARKVGLRAPVSEALVGRQPTGPVVKEVARLSLIMGTAAALVVVLLELLAFLPLWRVSGLPQMPEPALWKGALASLYGGITEELLCRLFLLSALALLLNWLSRIRDGLPTWTFWTANLLAALLFGLGHLPAAAILMPLTPLVITRILVLNAVPGLAFGWLYWKRGLESAMLGHGVADLLLHVVAPAVAGAVGGS